MHNIHAGANIHPGCTFAPWVYFGHVNGVLWKCTRVLICTRVQICSTFVGGANTVGQISKLARCKLRTWTQLVITYVQFDLRFGLITHIFYMNMYMCMKINYINSPFIKLKVIASFCSHYLIGYAGLPRRTTGISGPWASICTILFLNNNSS